MIHPADQQEPRLRRGQPLIVLALLLVGWIGLRAVLWEGLSPPGLPDRLVQAVVAAAPTKPTKPTAPLLDKSPIAAPELVRPAPVRQLAPLALPPVGATPPASAIPATVPLPPFASGGEPARSTETPRLAGLHQLAWMAGVAQLPVPLFLRDRLNGTDPAPSLTPAEARVARLGGKGQSRWSVDGWLLLRRGGAGLAAGGLPSPGYGASQAGAVVRYRLAPQSNHRPALYLRATSALQQPRGEEAALGLALRPLARVPLSLQAELRATRLASGTALRPALGLVTELDRFTLPAGLSGEVYAQGGYVGGRAASPFIEGQARIERRIARIGQAELRAGGGAWAGAQRGASRVDLGPGATLDFQLGAGQARIAADWRLRVAGNAAPTSGPALTLSAGF